MLKNGFYKVCETGNSITSATFYNPATKAEYSKIVWDIDDPRVENENRAEYLEPINEGVKSLWLANRGVIVVGSVVEVVKGRKIPKGTRGIVTAIKPYYDRYSRWQCDYAHLDNGQRTNIENLQVCNS